MARVIVDTWFATHASQVPQDALERRRATWGYAESQQGWDRTLREADPLSDCVLVATEGNEIIALAASKVTETGRVVEGNVVEVGALYVDLRCQRSGVGRRLLDALFAYWRRAGRSTLHIAVLAANDPARRFYEAMGGREAGERDDPEGQEIVYEWSLGADC